MFGRRKKRKDDFDDASFAANIARLDGVQESIGPAGDVEPTADATFEPDGRNGPVSDVSMPTDV